jgi:deoxyadenosine/deoxycytidine kinase
MTILRVEICGGIASGKTTLARVLRKHVAVIEFEQFKHNPFWQLFYQNPKEYAFATEVTFFLQHCAQIKRWIFKTGILVCDFSLIQDRAYADINLRDRQLTTFNVVYRHGTNEVGSPLLLIRLECSAKEQLARIRRRARSEEEGVQIRYLAELNKAIRNRVAALPRKTKVLDIDSEALDFAHDRQIQKRITKDILEAL